MSAARTVRPRSRAWSAVGTVASVVGVALVFLGAVVVGLLLHLDLPSARRFAGAQINRALASPLQGSIRIEQIDGLGIYGADGAQVVVIDPDGVQVIRLHGLRARISLLGLVRSVLFGKGDIEIISPSITVDRADVNLDVDASGTPRIARAFAVKPTGPGSPGARDVRVSLPQIRVAHAWAHGALNVVPPLDADVDGVHGAVSVVHGQVNVDVSEAKIVMRGMPRGANAVGAGTSHVAVPSKTGRAYGVEASFAGIVGAIPATALFDLDEDRIDAVVDVADAAAEDLRGLLPEAPLYGRIGAHLEAHGTASRFDAIARTKLGEGTVDVVGAFTIGDEISAIATVDARAVDVRSFTPLAPPSVLGATTNASLKIQRDGALTGVYTLDVLRGSIGANVVPHAALRGDLQRSKSGALGGFDFTVRGEGTIDEAGAPSQIVFGLHLVAGAPVVDVDVRTSIPRLDAVTRVGPIGQGRVALHAKAVVHVADSSVDANVDGAVDDFARGPVRVAHAHVSGHLHGRIPAAALDLTLVADGVNVKGLVFSHALLVSRGTLTEQDAELTAEGVNAPSVQAHAIVDLGTATTIRAGRVRLSRDDVTVVATVDSVRIAADDVRVDHVVMEGLGQTARATAHLTPSSFAVRADSKGLDLGRLGKLLRVEKTLLAGSGSFDVELAIAGNAATGRVVADFSHVSFPTVVDASLHVDAVIKGRRATGHARASIANVGYLDVTTTDAELAGSGPLTLDSWKQGFGTAEVDSECDLAAVWRLLPKDALPVDDVAGKLIVKARLARASVRETIPELMLTASTRGLVVAGGGKRPRPIPASDASTWHVSGIDVKVDARIDGDKGSSELVVRLLDDKGELAAVDAKSKAVPYAAILAEGSDVAAIAMKTRFSATGVFPRRSLEKLKPFVDAKDAHGDVEASFGFEGTILEPNVEVLAKAYGIKSATAPVTMKMGVDLVAHYDGTHGDAAFTIHSPRAVVLVGNVHGAVKVADALFKKPGEEIAWDASASARAIAFPLGAVSALADRQVRGQVTGDLSVTDFHKDARAKLDASIANLEIGAQKLTGAKIAAFIDESRLHASARVDQTDGFARASAVVGLKWGSLLVPMRDEALESEASLEASRFRVAALLPLVEDIFSDLDGRINARVKFTMDPNGKSPRLQGNAQLTEGLFQLAVMGEEYHGVAAKLSMQPDGAARLDDVVAYGVTGKLTGSAAGHFEGLHLVDAQGSATIPKGQALPLDVNGTSMGDLYGDFKVDVKASPDRKILNVAVDVPVMHVRLPPSTTRTVQELDEPANTHVGTYDRVTHRFVDLPIDGEDLRPPKAPSTRSTETIVVVNLGRDVQIERGTGLKVTLDGTATVRIAAETRVSGQIRLLYGTVDVQGKPFEIEKGIITFVGSDPSNPDVVITAGWTAPDGTRVYADFNGSLKSGRVTLRSSPPRPNNEILALILFGTVSGSSATPYTQSTTSGGAVAGSAAAGAAGGTVTQGLNRALDSLTGLAISTKIDTSSSTNPRPEVEIQIARNISLQVAIVLGTPPPGTNQDTTYLTMDWRFARRWSLATTFGDKGSSIGDVIWQYRY